MGLCSYYRCFVKDFAKLGHPLHKLSEKGARCRWMEECQEAFQVLKQWLILSIGVVISQVINEEEHHIAFGLRSLTKAERRYWVTIKELLAVIFFVKHFKHYL